MVGSSGIGTQKKREKEITKKKEKKGPIHSREWGSFSAARNRAKRPRKNEALGGTVPWSCSKTRVQKSRSTFLLGKSFFRDVAARGPRPSIARHVLVQGCILLWRAKARSSRVSFVPRQGGGDGLSPDKVGG